MGRGPISGGHVKAADCLKQGGLSEPRERRPPLSHDPTPTPSR
jgi:hypothetical protein